MDMIHNTGINRSNLYNNYIILLLILQIINKMGIIIPNTVMNVIILSLLLLNITNIL